MARTRPANPQDPADPAYVWPETITSAIQESRGRGIRVALLVSGTPDWANGAKGLTTRPTNPQDYADFMVAAARRYTRVKHWMVWGEPQRDGIFEPFTPDSPAARAPTRSCSTPPTAPSRACAGRSR